MQDELAIPEEFEAQPRSRVMWMLYALGLNATLLPLAALVAFTVVLVLILRGRGPALVGAILLIVPLPLYVALLGAVRGTVAAFAVLSLTDVQPRPSEVLQGLAEVSMNILVGIVLTIPAFLVAAVGLTVRALQSEPSNSESLPPRKE